MLSQRFAVVCEPHAYPLIFFWKEKSRAVYPLDTAIT